MPSAYRSPAPVSSTLTTAGCPKRSGPNTGDTLRDVLGDPLFTPVPHAALERDLAVGDPHVDVGGVDVTVRREAIADVLADALVGALVAARAAARVRALRALRTPRRRIAPPGPLDVALPAFAAVSHVACPRRTDVALRRARVRWLAEAA